MPGSSASVRRTVAFCPTIDPVYDGGGDKRGAEIVARKLVVACRDATEVLDPAPHALDAVAAAVDPGVVGYRLGARRGRGNDSQDLALGEALAEVIGVIAAVGDQAADRQAMIEQIGCHGDIVDVASAEQQHARAPLSVGQPVELRCPAAARPADRLREGPPFAPPAERWALMWVLSIAAVPITGLWPVRASKIPSQIPCRLQRLKRL